MTTTAGISRENRPERTAKDAGPADRDKTCNRVTLEELVTRHGRQVARTVHRLLGWSDGADDVVQEVFLAAFKKLESFRGESEISTWLTRIAINKTPEAVILRYFESMSGDQAQVD